MTRNVIIAQIGSLLRIVGTPTIAISGVAYSFTFTAVGGTAPYIFSIMPGFVGVDELLFATFPPGISASGATISGTTNNAVSVVYTVTLTDSNRNQVSAIYKFICIDQLDFRITDAGDFRITDIGDIRIV